jgi:hypothetical protein
MMSRILDDIAKADERRKQNSTAAPGEAGAEKGLETAPFLGIERQAISGAARMEAAARVNRRAERRALHCSYGAALVVALVAGMSLDRYLVERPPAKRPLQGQALPRAEANSAPRSHSAPAGLPVAVPNQPNFPSCIPLDAEDTGYAAKQPGWRRYLSAAVEFRVFRKNGSVVAIQVLARRKEPLADSFLASFLGQVAGRAPYQSNSRRKRAGYLIEKGRLGRLAEVTTYRNMASDGIRALVVVYLPT